MPERETTSLFDILRQLYRASVDVVGNLRSLLRFELELASRSLVWLVVLFFVGLVILSSTWIFLFATLAAGLVALKFSWLVALLIVAAVHLLLLILLGLWIYRLCYRLTLPATRRQLHMVGKTYADIINTSTEEKDSSE